MGYDLLRNALYCVIRVDTRPKSVKYHERMIPMNHGASACAMRDREHQQQHAYIYTDYSTVRMPVASSDFEFEFSVIS